jgi:2-oxoglutarate dehydrogenase E2 component (dihydrolipoamide succinyltransferase)
MSYIEVVLPQMGEGIIEAVITRWFADINSKVTIDEPLVEIATDKVDSEIPAPASGIVLKKFFSVGEIPKVGDVIAIIQSNNNSNISNTEISSLETISNFEEKPGFNALEVQKETPFLYTSGINTSPQDDTILPFIRHFAKQRGISIDELSILYGSGENGAITKGDVINYYKSGKKQMDIKDTSSKSDTMQETSKAMEYIPSEGEEVVEIDRMRKIIAGRMLQSIQTAPHVTSFIDVDITALVQWREKNKKSFIEQFGVNLTYTPIITEIVVQALKEFPGINVSLVGDNLIKKKYINIGIATALPDGNLIVPVIKGADKINLSKLALEIHDLVSKARAGKLNPGETLGGTFTITNLGQFDTVSGTPIINQPESAILAVGAIKKKPWVVETNSIHSIGIRDIVTLSLSYDHRIIDGALGGGFLSRIGYLIGNKLPQI